MFTCLRRMIRRLRSLSLETTYNEIASNNDSAIDGLVATTNSLAVDESKDEICRILKLPTELIQMILPYLDKLDILIMKQVSSRFSQILANELTIVQTRGEKFTLRSIFHRDIYAKLLQIERCFPSTTGMCCSGCLEEHPIKAFDKEELTKDGSVRLCRGTRRSFRLCPHKRFSFRDLERMEANCISNAEGRGDFASVFRGEAVAEELTNCVACRSTGFKAELKLYTQVDDINSPGTDVYSSWIVATHEIKVLDDYSWHDLNFFEMERKFQRRIAEMEDRVCPHLKVKDLAKLGKIRLQPSTFQCPHLARSHCYHPKCNVQVKSILVRRYNAPIVLRVVRCLHSCENALDKNWLAAIERKQVADRGEADLGECNTSAPRLIEIS